MMVNESCEVDFCTAISDIAVTDVKRSSWPTTSLNNDNVDSREGGNSYVWQLKKIGKAMSDQELRAKLKGNSDLINFLR